ncbi:EamA family transporter [Rhodanobacter geophilus]|uniref:EamA family transporter n=1 Tax=Rhodanobacter geophilus TaxID=3162488 RepID=A0ABV3QR03_9GAMM
MNIVRLIQVLLSVLGISSGQLLLKMAAMNLKNPNAVGIWLGRYCINLYLIAGIGLLGISTLLWIWVLRTLPLSLAYPFMALAFIIVPILGHFLLNEPLGVRNFLGGVLIALGVVVVSI